MLRYEKCKEWVWFVMCRIKSFYQLNIEEHAQLSDTTLKCYALVLAI